MELYPGEQTLRKIELYLGERTFRLSTREGRTAKGNLYRFSLEFYRLILVEQEIAKAKGTSVSKFYKEGSWLLG